MEGRVSIEAAVARIYMTVCGGRYLGIFELTCRGVARYVRMIPWKCGVKYVLQSTLRYSMCSISPRRYGRKTWILRHLEITYEKTNLVIGMLPPVVRRNVRSLTCRFTSYLTSSGKLPNQYVWTWCPQLQTRVWNACGLSNIRSS